MKKVVYVLLATLAFACNHKKDEKLFEVDGEIKNTTATIVYLEENVPDAQLTIVDSAQLKDGKFNLKTNAKEESLYQLRLEGEMTPFALLISDVAELKVKADRNNTTQPYSVEGSPATLALIEFDKTIYDKGMNLYAAGNKRDSMQNAKVPDSLIVVEHAHVNALADSLKSFAKNFLLNAKSPTLTLYALSSFQNTADNLGMQGLTQSEATEIIDQAAIRFPSHTAIQNLQKRKARDFSQPGVDGKPVSLSSFRGKYVLLDFWASWCRPCRMDNPNVVNAYQEFKDKNFTVFGVSLDQDRNAWMQAIQQDGLTWTHASDLKQWNNAAAALYGVQSIPANFLIDPQGNIIAQDLHGEQITRTLREVIK